jgi:hypothetical protein
VPITPPLPEPLPVVGGLLTVDPPQP